MQNYKHDVSPDWGLATQMVHGGLTRSQHAETAEAIYMTSGYVYQSAEEAQAAFDNSQARASSMAASATRPSRCSRSAWRCWKAPKPRAPPPAAWRQCSLRSPAW